MTDPMPTIMQAAERLRRWKAKEPLGDIYPRCPTWAQSGNHYRSFIRRDREILADFALSILPKGERPVAIDRNGPHNTGWLAYAGSVEKAERIDGAWHVVHEVEDWNGTSVLKFDAYGDIYESADDARAELHWRRLEQLQVAAVP